MLRKEKLVATIFLACCMCTVCNDLFALFFFFFFFFFFHLVWNSFSLIWEKRDGCFDFLWLMVHVCVPWCGLFAFPLALIGRLSSVTSAILGHLLYCFHVSLVVP